jgi:CRISPR-associated exonuclease Cas4
MSEFLKPDDDYPPLSALNDLLYCERRCALHRIEGVWVDNAHTISGTFDHRRADKPVTWENTSGVRQVHALWLRSERLRLVGKADVVEFHHNANATQAEVPYPIEYKRGKRKKWDNDDVQLCAQALCLEEMLGVTVPRGAIFHIKTKRRREVEFTEKLHAKTVAAAVRLHALIAAGITPAAVFKPQCHGCSLRELCLPQLGSQRAVAREYCGRLFVLHEGDL